MSLIKDLESALIVAMKEKQETDLSVLRMLKASLKNKAIELKKDLEDKDVVLVLKSEIKKRKESIETYNQAERQDLVDKEQVELSVLEKYLPAQMSEADIREKVEAVYASATDEEKGNFGLIMKKTMSELKGDADGGLVSKVVKDVVQK